MLGEFNLFKFMGVPVIIDWSLIGLVIILLAISSYSWAITLTAVGSLLLAVALHEFGHTYAAKKLKLKVKAIKLMALGGAAMVEDMKSISNKNVIIISIAGPLVNLALGVLASGILLPLMVAGIATPILSKCFIIFIGINLILFVFNMIPMFPLDGGRILEAIFKYKFPQNKAAKYTWYTSVALGAAMLGVGLFFMDPFIIFTIPFLMGAAYFNYKEELTYG